MRGCCDWQTGVIITHQSVNNNVSGLPSSCCFCCRTQQCQLFCVQQQCKTIIMSQLYKSIMQSSDGMVRLLRQRHEAELVVLGFLEKCLVRQRRHRHQQHFLTSTESHKVLQLYTHFLQSTKVKLREITVSNVDQVLEDAFSLLERLKEGLQKARIPNPDFVHAFIEVLMRHQQFLENVQVICDNIIRPITATSREDAREEWVREGSFDWHTCHCPFPSSPSSLMSIFFSCCYPYHVLTSTGKTAEKLVIKHPQPPLKPDSL